MQGILHDVIVVSRKLRRRPVWALTVVAVLALGIGANAAMFAAFDAWVTRPLPFAEPDRLFVLNESQADQGASRQPVSPRNLADWRERQSSFERLEAFRRVAFNLADEGDPARVRGARITHSLFGTLGVQPVLGRALLPEDDRRGQQPTVVLISHRLWRQRYGGLSDAVGRSIRLDGRPFEIVGVMPEDFRFPVWEDVWTPIGFEPRATERDERWLSVIGRLRPSRTLDQARADLRTIAREIERESPQTSTSWSVAVRPLRDMWVPPVIGVALSVCLFTGGCLLLIVCANVASLLLAEATSGAQETAIRSALGASRWRLARQTLVECVLLAGAAGIAGAVISLLWANWLTGRAPIEPPYLFFPQLDARVLFYTLAASLLAGAASASAPLLRRAGRRLHDELKAGGRSASMPPATARLRNGLIVGELALSTALAIGALLLVKSFWLQRNEAPGYRTAGLYAMQLSLAGPGLEIPESRVDYLRRLEAELRASGGISSVGVADRLPAGGYSAVRVEAPERPAQRQGGERVSRYSIGGRYLDALEVPTVSGRRFTRTELEEGGDVVIVSASLAQALWGEQDAVGRSLRAVEDDQREPWLTVVGVVADVDSPQDMVTSGDRPPHEIYRPYAAVPGSSVHLVVDSPQTAADVAAAVRGAVRRAGLPVPVAEILTMGQTIGRSQWVTRVFSEQLAIYAVMALLIATVGFYGLVADSVGQRAKEIAIRLALGARPRDIQRAIVTKAAKLGAAGLGGGLVLGIGVAQLSRSTLGHVHPGDPLVLSAVALLLAGTSVAASWGPARRAANADPARALQAE